RRGGESGRGGTAPAPAPRGAFRERRPGKRHPRRPARAAGKGGRRPRCPPRVAGAVPAVRGAETPGGPGRAPRTTGRPLRCPVTRQASPGPVGDPAPPLLDEEGDLARVDHVPQRGGALLASLDSEDPERLAVPEHQDGRLAVDLQRLGPEPVPLLFAHPQQAAEEAAD